MDSDTIQRITCFKLMDAFHSFNGSIRFCLVLLNYVLAKMKNLYRKVKTPVLESALGLSVKRVKKIDIVPCNNNGKQKPSHSFVFFYTLISDALFHSSI